jgi:hypothetical protein
MLFYSCFVEQDVYFGTGGLAGRQAWNIFCWLCDYILFCMFWWPWRLRLLACCLFPPVLIFIE